MKKILTFIILLMILLITYYNKDNIVSIINKYINENNNPTTLINNDYATSYNFEYIKLTDNFRPNNKQELINVFYTIINSGMGEFTFYCNYDECMNDVDYISKDKMLLSDINNFVHPYNSFSNLETTRYENVNKITIRISHNYSDDQIKQINEKVDKVIAENINNNMMDDKKIKVIHDYIIDNTKYDSDKSDNNINNYLSDIAYGPLFQGYGVCNGYSDLMYIFLNKLGIKSIKIASENHIWNLVYFDNEWLHLDLTWDDPVMENEKEIIDYTYFLITTEELLNIKDDQHYYDKNIYLEAN